MIRPLGTAKVLLENAGYSITYIHDDLVFVNNTAFLLRFDDNNRKNLFLHFNINCNNLMIHQITEKLAACAGQINLNLTRSVKFQLDPSNEKDVLNIEFLIA